MKTPLSFLAPAFAAQTPAPLPPGPLLPRLLLENPWPLAGAIAAGGAIAWLVLRGRNRTRAGTVAAAAGLAGAAALVLVARARVTEPERLRARVAELVSAAAAADEDRLTRLLAPDAQVWIGDRAAADGRDAILARVRATLAGPWAVKEHSVLVSRARVDGPRVARTQVQVRVVPEATGFPDASWWTIHWRRDAAGEWAADRIEPWTPDIAEWLR